MSHEFDQQIRYIRFKPLALPEADLWVAVATFANGSIIAAVAKSKADALRQLDNLIAAKAARFITYASTPHRFTRAGPSKGTPAVFQ